MVSGLVADVQTLKVQHPDLAILVSLGGDSVAGEVIEILKTSLPLLFLKTSFPRDISSPAFPQVFRSIVSRKDQLANFTASLNSLYQDEIIQVGCCNLQ